MFSQLHMREEQVLLAQDYALETARAEGLEQGLERGKVEGRAERKLFAFLQGLLTSEVASQQLGMSVSEFEALL
ncbi:adenylosuccinate lyase [Streptococcus pneumoniae]|nr:adenylosuccinate lyase [Streptococcus pneumoniae]